MLRLARLLPALLALTLLAANSASAITAVLVEKPASGLLGALERRVGIDALASSDRIDEKLSLRYDFASDFPVATRGAAGTLKGLGNIGSHSVVDAGTALSAGQRWLGAGYKEIAPGVFRSADGLRQFRMTNADLLPTHGNLGSHVHFEALDRLGKVIENLHLPVTP